MPNRSGNKKREGRKSEAVRLRNRVQQKKLIQQRKQFFCFFWIVCFAIRCKNAIGARPSCFLAVLRDLMHGRRQRAISCARKIVTFPDFLPSLAETKFYFNAPPYAPAKAFYLYLHRSTNKYSKKNEKWRKSLRVENFTNSRCASNHSWILRDYKTLPTIAQREFDLFSIFSARLSIWKTFSMGFSLKYSPKIYIAHLIWQLFNIQIGNEQTIEKPESDVCFGRGYLSNNSVESQIRLLWELYVRTLREIKDFSISPRDGIEKHRLKASKLLLKSNDRIGNFSLSNSLAFGVLCQFRHLIAIKSRKIF